MGTNLNNAPILVQDDNPVSSRDRIKLVSNDDKRGILAQYIHSCSNTVLILGVKCAGSLVKEDDRRIFKERAGDRNALAFTAGEGSSPLADTRFPPEWQTRDDFIDATQTCSFLKLGVTRFRAADTNIRHKSIVEKIDILENQGKLCHQLCWIPLANITASYTHSAAIHVIETGNQTGNCRLSTA